MLRKIFGLLTPDERSSFALLCVFMFFGAIIDVVAVAIIAPLIAVIISPETLNGIPKLPELLSYLGYSDEPQRSIFLGVVVCLTLIAQNISNIINTYFSLKFSYNREYTIGWRLLKSYLYQDYIFFSNRNTTNILRNTSVDVSFIVSNTLSQILVLISKSISAIAITVFIFYVNPFVTATMAFILGIAYAGIFALTKSYIYESGKALISLYEKKLRQITDTIKIAKDIKMLNAEKVFLNQFAVTCAEYSKIRTNADIITVIPRYILEIFAIAALIFTIIHLSSNVDEIEIILPIVGIYAFAGYRLLPSLQLIYQAVSKIKLSSHSLDNVCKEMENLNPSVFKNSAKSIPNISFKSCFELKSVFFSYKTDEVVLKDIKLKVRRGEKVGIIGGSGAGKSTLVDMLVGLSAPNEGGLYVDGKLMDPADYPGWRQNVAYISQNVYLLDDTIDMNISLADREEDIDEALANKARASALVDEFLADMNETPKLITGENGIRLSGGQRQRIGIARALYQNRDILVLDEATSALDQDTEKRLLQNIEKEDKTMVLITHRVETLEFCDRIYVLADGQIADTGTYDELKKSSKHFKKLAKALD